jgi:hypothetical protein
MRIAFTIIYNGEHHIVHNDFGNIVPKYFDYWLIVEGLAGINGPSSWYNEMPDKTSIDNTVKKILEIQSFNNNIIFTPSPLDGWPSKDFMVNVALHSFDHILSGLQNEIIFLWQIDIDEQWTLAQLDEAEKMLVDANSDCGCFHANYYVGRNLIAKGFWGEGNNICWPIENAYRRLWNWKGQEFQTHAPPVLIGGNGKEILLPQRFNHYSYYFEKDAIFKSQYYKGYENLHKKWLSLQKITTFPQPINRLIDGYWSNTDTVIERIDQ